MVELAKTSMLPGWNYCVISLFPLLEFRKTFRDSFTLCIAPPKKPQKQKQKTKKLQFEPVFFLLMNFCIANRCIQKHEVYQLTLQNVDKQLSGMKIL